MNQYNFNLSGLGVTLKTPFPIQISENLRPFLCLTDLEQADCNIEIIIGSLPKSEQSGYWHGPEYYEMQGIASASSTAINLAKNLLPSRKLTVRGMFKLR